MTQMLNGIKQPIETITATKTLRRLSSGMLLFFFVVMSCYLTVGAEGQGAAVSASRRGTAQQFESGIAKSAICGVALQKMIMRRCEHIAWWNRPYQYDGVGDCYGYCRQVWNAILFDGKEHTEDYYPHKYNKKRWLDVKGGIPVNTYPDTNWVCFSNSTVLLPGDLLATHQGHRWGANWHGGIYAGNDENWDCSKHNGLNGAYKRPLFDGFHYYYKPLHELLTTNSPAEP